MQRDEVVTALGALAQQTRLETFRLLVKAGPEGLAAGAIAELLEVPLPTLSFHLQQLRTANLINRRRESRSLIYSAQYDRMNALFGYLSENCCMGASSQSPKTRTHLRPSRETSVRRSLRVMEAGHEK